MVVAALLECRRSAGRGVAFCKGELGHVMGQIVVGAARELGEAAPEKAERLVQATEDAAAKAAPQVGLVGVDVM